MADSLRSDEVHIWLLPRPMQMHDNVLALVTLEEQQRAQGMISIRRQCEWLAGRALLRQCLGHYAGFDGLALQLEKTDAGKPVLVYPDAPAFNLSHGPGWIGCAVARSACVGLDIDSEARRNRIDEIAERFFHPEEQSAIAAAADAAGRRQAFFQSWTLKEAYIKALGETINGARLHELGFAGNAAPLFALPPGNWQFRHWRFDNDQHLALACQWRECDTVDGAATRCRFWICEPDLHARREITEDWPC